MANIFVGMGSNLFREKNIRNGLCALETVFGSLTLSSIYENEAMGFVGQPFYNLVIKFFSELPPSKIIDHLHSIEQQHGRPAKSPSFRSRTLDLDLLLYDDLIIFNSELELPRKDILQYPFVLRPLAEIAGSQTHPQFQLTYNELWSKFKKNSSVLKKINITKIIGEQKELSEKEEPMDIYYLGDHNTES